MNMLLFCLILFSVVGYVVLSYLGNILIFRRLNSKFSPDEISDANINRQMRVVYFSFISFPLLILYLTILNIRLYNSKEELSRDGHYYIAVTVYNWIENIFGSLLVLIAIFGISMLVIGGVTLAHYLWKNL